MGWEDTIRKEDQAAAQPAPVSWEQTVAPDQSTYEYTAPPGLMEALARGSAQGLTFGLADEIGAAGSTLLDTLTGENSALSILDDYRKHRDESRENFAAAEAAHPTASMVGNIAGGFVPALLTAGGSAPATLGALAKSGIKYGALAGLGNTEADLTRGEVGKAAKDVAISGAIGGVLAPVADEAVKIAGPGVKAVAQKVKNIGHIAADLGPISTVGEALKQGAMGRRLIGKEANKSLNKEIIDTAASAGDDVAIALNESSKKKMASLIGEGPDVNLGSWDNATRKMIEKLRVKYGANEAVLKDIEKVANIINRDIYGVADNGIPGKELIRSTEDAETLLRQLGSLGSQGDESLKTSVGKELVNRLVSPLRRDENLIDRAMGIPDSFQTLTELVNASRPAMKDPSGKIIREGLEDINARTSQLLTAKEQVPSIADIANLEKTSTGGISASDRISTFLKSLPEDISGKYSNKMTDLSKAKHVADAIAAPGLSKGIVEKVLHSSTYGGANLIGLAGRGLYDLTPDMVKKLGGHVGSMGSEAAVNLSRILQQAAEKDQVGRNALFFAIQQNPEYRKILRQATGQPEEDVEVQK